MLAIRRVQDFPQKSLYNAPMRDYGSAIAFHLLGYCVHRVLNATAKLHGIFTSGSAERGIRGKPSLRILRILQCDLSPIQSFPEAESYLAERGQKLDLQVRALSDRFRRLAGTLQIAAKYMGERTSAQFPGQVL